MNIKELAEQAGFFPSDNYDHSNWHAAGFSKNFERFAELVAAAEREKCAKVCDDIDVEYQGEDVLATWCAEAIRARGDKHD